MDYVNDVTEYVRTHPRLVGFLALTAVLAIIGLWYVIKHHLQMIVVTILCGMGFFAGGLVFYRGWSDQILVWVGVFLMIVFPVIWLRAIATLKPKGRPAPQQPASALFDLEIKPKRSQVPKT